MKTIRVLSIFLLLSVVVSGMISQVRAENPEGVALEEYLINHSPWKGRWNTGSWGGEVAYVFERIDGKFSAKITETTGTSNDWGARGPVRNLKVEKDKIHFTSLSDTDHTFWLDKKGNIKGRGKIWSGRSTDTYLKPTK